VANPILKPETARSIFVPALTEIGSKSLSNFIMAKGMQWPTALALTTLDWPKRRKKGSAFCKQTFFFLLFSLISDENLPSQGLDGQEHTISWTLQLV